MIKILLSIVSFILFLSCENDKVMVPSDPSAPEEFEISVIETTVVAINLTDTISVRRIFFKSYTDNETTPFLYTIYKRTIGQNNFAKVDRSFRINNVFSQDTIISYLNASGDIEKILYTNTSYIDDTINFRMIDSTEYAISRFVNMSETNTKADFALGRESAIVLFDSVFISGKSSGLIINNGAKYTSTRNVNIEIQLNITGAKEIRIYNLSMLENKELTLENLKNIDSARTNTDTVRIKLGADFVDLFINEDNEIYKKDATGKVSYWGANKKTDTTAINLLSSEFTLEDLGQGYVNLLLTDSLPLGLGFKYIFVELVYEDSTKGSIYFQDYINITNFRAELTVDLSRVNFRKVYSTGEVCLIDEHVPFKFDVYGDTTFADSIEFWIATMASYRNFFDANNKMRISADEYLSFDFATSKRLFIPIQQSIFETKTQKYKLNRGSTIYGSFDSSTFLNYNVSNLNNFSIDATVNLDHQKNNGLATLTKPGSILGYKQVDLSFPPNWYNSGSYSLDSLEGLKDSLSRRYTEVLTTYDNKAKYKLPFKNFPARLSLDKGSSYKVGAKEFVILAYTKGKYFKESRVFISVNSSSSRFYWDKTPPHFNWTKNFDNKISSSYVPLYYKDDLIQNESNLLLENYNISVTLDKGFSDAAGVKDMGFGNITSVKFMYHRKSEYNIDTLSGKRLYPDNSGILYEVPIKSSYLSKPTNQLTKVVFDNIDLSYLTTGIYDIWVETADDLGNEGIAPLGAKFSDISANTPTGLYITRQMKR